MKILQRAIVYALLCASPFAFETKAQVIFQESSVESGLIFNYKESLKMGGGAASFDYDNDGDDDLYIVGGQNPDGLFENDGSGNFTNVSLVTNINYLTDSVMTTSVVTGDIDNDGIREIFIGTIGDLGTSFASIQANLLLKYNSNTGQYENITHAALVEDNSFCMGAHFFDSNLDGHLDLYLINYVSEPKTILDGSEVIGFDHTCFENKLYINSGDGTFSDQTDFYELDEIGCSLAATSSDLDWDGDPDLIIANDFGKWLEPNQLFQNEGADKPYENISAQSNTNAQMYAMGIAVGDYDEDLDLDFYVTNIGENAFFENEGDMNFINMAEDLSIQNTYTTDGLFTTGWGAIMEDFNNDSYMDLFVSNGYVYSVVDIDDTEQADELFIGSPQFDFTNVTKDCGIDFNGTSRGALYGDWNRDGQLDLITITNEVSEDDSQNSINYYENLSSDGHWIGFQLTGTNSNRDAYGAKVIVYADGRSLMRELRGGDSHASQNSSMLHFGLSDIQHVDSIKIFWPSGIEETLEGLSTNTYHSITEGVISSTTNTIEEDDLSIYPNPASGFLNIDIHKDKTLPLNLKVYNTLGNLILERQITNNQNQIDISQLPSGLYNLVCSSTTDIITSPIILLTPKF